MPDTYASQADKPFIPVILTILICALSLLLSASIPGLLYFSGTGEKTFELQDLSLFFGETVFFFLQLLPFTVALFTLLLCVKFIHRQPIRPLITSRRVFSWKKALTSFFAWLLILVLSLIFELLQKDNHIRWNYQDSFWLLLPVSLFLVTLQTAFEEIFFRGYLMKYVFPSKHKWIPVILTSLLFALMHLSNPEIGLLGKIVLIYFVGTGIFLALMAVLDKGLELSLGFHAANNLFATLVLTNNWQVFQTDALFMDFSTPEISAGVWINLFFLFPVLLFIYGKSYKWDFGSIFVKFAKNSRS